jgi:hypothetical protein
MDGWHLWTKRLAWSEAGRLLLGPDRPTSARTVLVLDQFEELFTALSPAQQKEYADSLTGAVARDDVTVVVVVVVRSDYYGQAAAHPGVRDLLVADVTGEPGGLPLMSTALLSLWEQRDGHQLKLAAYHAMGGVRTAVARLAEHAYGQLTSGQQSVARRILLRLADVGEAGEPVRRRVLPSPLLPRPLRPGQHAVSADPGCRAAPGGA